jgi:hypothetical protein
MPIFGRRKFLVGSGVVAAATLQPPPAPADVPPVPAKTPDRVEPTAAPLNRTCQWCKWWDLYSVRNSQTDRAEVFHGTSAPCRRNAPVTEIGKYGRKNAVWGETYAKDWCGDWEAPVFPLNQ